MILFVGDVLAPRRALALVVDLEHGKVRHEAVRRGAVPVLLTRLEEHAIPWPDGFNWPATTLAEAGAFGDIDGLAVGMRVPRRSRARCEVDVARRQARGRRWRRDRVDKDGAGKPLTRPRRGLDGVPGDLHVVLPCSGWAPRALTSDTVVGPRTRLSRRQFECRGARLRSQGGIDDASGV